MPTLYHASINRDIEVITPQRTLSNDKYVGDFVFATEDKILATMYLATRGYATLMDSHNEQPNIVICADRAEYEAGDKGGAIYELLPASFTKSPQKALSEYELVSREPVRPTNKHIYEKSIIAMQEAGVVIRFVDEGTFNRLLGNPKQAELIKKLPALQ